VPATEAEKEVEGARALLGKCTPPWRMTATDSSSEGSKAITHSPSTQTNTSWADWQEEDTSDNDEGAPAWQTKGCTLETRKPCPDILKKTRMCPHLMQYGHCSREMCTFAHSREELQPRPDLTKTRLCSLFMRGVCPYENSCKFAHGENELQKQQQQQQPSSQPQHRNTAEQDIDQQDEEKPQKTGLEAEEEEKVAKSAAAEQEVPRHKEVKSQNVAASAAAGSSLNSEPRRRRSSSPVPRAVQAKEAFKERAAAAEEQRSHHARRLVDPSSEESDRNSGSHGEAGTCADAEQESKPAPPVSRASRLRRPAPIYPPPAPPVQVSSGTAAALEDQIVSGKAPKPQGTTVMVLNIPSFLTQGALLRLFEDLSAKLVNEVDFFHVPWDADEGCNHSYAILNFSSRAAADGFKAHWDGKHLMKDVSEAALRIVPGILQGFSANVRHFSPGGEGSPMKAGTDPKFKPLLRDVPVRPASLLGGGGSSTAKRSPSYSRAPHAPPPPQTSMMTKSSNKDLMLHAATKLRRHQSSSDSWPSTDFAAESDPTRAVRGGAAGRPIGGGRGELAPGYGCNSMHLPRSAAPPMKTSSWSMRSKSHSDSWSRGPPIKAESHHHQQPQQQKVPAPVPASHESVNNNGNQIAAAHPSMYRYWQPVPVMQAEPMQAFGCLPAPQPMQPMVAAAPMMPWSYCFCTGPQDGSMQMAAGEAYMPSWQWEEPDSSGQSSGNFEQSYRIESTSSTATPGTDQQSFSGDFHPSTTTPREPWLQECPSTPLTPCVI